MRISNTNSKNRLWVNIYLLGIFWKNYQFFDSTDPFFNIIRKYLENEGRCNHGTIRTLVVSSFRINPYTERMKKHK